MNRKKLGALVALSVNSVVLLSNQLGAEEMTGQTAEAAQSAMTPEQETFASKLNQQAGMVFKNMSAQHRAMCMQMANHECKGKNACKGTGACKSADHACAGMNACKGQGSCKMDPNKAVKAMAEKMMQKRSSL